MTSKKNNLSKLEIALRKNLRKRKEFQKKTKKKNKKCQFNLISGLFKWPEITI